MNETEQFPTQSEAASTQSIPPFDGGGGSIDDEFDKLEALNQRAAATQHEAEQLTWPPQRLTVTEDGHERTLEPQAMLWTAGREVLFDALQAADGGTADSKGRGPADARIVLYLATNDASAWTARRGRAAPLRSNYSEFLAAIDAWADHWIPFPVKFDAVETAQKLLTVCGQAVFVRVEDGPSGEKKNPLAPVR